MSEKTRTEKDPLGALEEIVRRATELPNYQLAIDLEERTAHDDPGFSAGFQIPKLQGPICRS